MYDIHLKHECKQKFNDTIKNASDDVMIEIIKDGRTIPNNMIIVHILRCFFSKN